MENTILMAADLETYVSDDTSKQNETWAWASALCPLYSENVVIHHSLGETYQSLAKSRENYTLYYHNLKFDGQFWLDYLLRNGFATAWELDGGWKNVHQMPNKSFTCLISDMGQWYSVAIKTEYGYIIELVDSLKLIPFTLRQAGKAFECKHQKLEMDYAGYRDESTTITDEEKEYIANDVLCLKECIEYMLDEGYKKATIGSNCSHVYKEQFFPGEYRDEFGGTTDLFPDLTKEELPQYLQEWTKCRTADEYIRKSYHGGWCHVKKGCEGKIYEDGQTLDVNSLYPSMMSSESGNYYPVGKPTFWCGNFIPEKATEMGRVPVIRNGVKVIEEEKKAYFFIRFKCRFYLKDGKLPFVQIKNNPLYPSTRQLETSDVYYNGEYHKYLLKDGKYIPTEVTMTMTETDYYLFLEQYDVVDFEILDGCYFGCLKGIFDGYINYYAEIKKKEKGVKRNLAKLFLNNLYGQFAKSPDSSYKLPYLDENGDVKYSSIEEYEKKTWYIPIGAAITSYARNFTIRAAQANYETFIYADTDSLHLSTQEDAKGVVIHDVDFCCWKKETQWNKGLFARQKTYIEITGDDWDIKCAGMTQTCKDYFKQKVEDGEWTLNDFRKGLNIPSGKLRPKRVKGGIVLVDSSYVMR